MPAYSPAMLKSPSRFDPRHLLALTLCLGLAACAESKDDAPWLHKGAPPPTASSSTNTASSAPSIAHKIVDVPAQTVVVQAGDTLPSLSRHYGVSIRALIQINTLTPPYDLVSGHRLTIPAGRYYIVGSGDSLLGIARATGTHLTALGAFNDLQPPYNIHPGQRLAIPSGNTTTVASNAPLPVVAKTPTDKAAPPAPKPAKTSSASPATAPEAQPAPISQPAPIAAAEPNKASPAPTPATADDNAPVAAPPPRAGRAFAWPVTGTVIAKYGPGAAEGTSNPGINIAVPVGTPVHAADNGVVVYAGNELAGFGNLLLVKHDGGWMTVYAHNQQLLVHKGAVVHRGQIIAKSGNTGKVDQPQLHFEVRKEADSVDPMDYLGK